MTDLTTKIENHTLDVHTPAPTDVEVYTSRSGSGPMRPRMVHLHYDLTGRFEPSVRIVGDRLKVGAFGPRSTVFTRRLRGYAEIDAAPGWIRTLVTDHDPGIPCRRGHEGAAS